MDSLDSISDDRLLLAFQRAAREIGEEPQCDCPIFASEFEFQISRLVADDALRSLSRRDIAIPVEVTRQGEMLWSLA